MCSALPQIITNTYTVLNIQNDITKKAFHMGRPFNFMKVVITMQLRASLIYFLSWQLYYHE